MVILPRPNDYHPDHRNTGLVVRDAAYNGHRSQRRFRHPPLAKNPLFLYCRDSFERPNPFRPDVAVDVTSVYEKKILRSVAHFDGTGTMTCTYGVPFHMTKGPPLWWSVGIASSEAASGTSSIKCGPETTHSLSGVAPVA